MELNEKLQELRKAKGMTQEELAEVLYVSRTAISKWESGRGTPSIESLKQLSAFFSVSIDDLLSAERALSLAEQESKTKQQNRSAFWIGITDVCALMLTVLPLYPNAAGKTVYAVNLLSYPNARNLFACLALLFMLFFAGALEIILVCLQKQRGCRFIIGFSLLLSMISVLFLIAARICYAAAVLFLLLVLKGILLLCRGR